MTAPITTPFEGVSNELELEAEVADEGLSPRRIVVTMVVEGKTWVRVLYTASVGSALGVRGKFGIEKAQLPQQLGNGGCAGGFGNFVKSDAGCHRAFVGRCTGSKGDAQY